MAISGRFKIGVGGKLLLADDGRARLCDCCPQFVPLVRCDGTETSYVLRSTAPAPSLIELGLGSMVYDDICLRAARDELGNVIYLDSQPPGTTAIDAAEGSDCCGRPVYRCCQLDESVPDPPLFGYAPTSLAPGNYDNSRDTCPAYIPDVVPTEEMADVIDPYTDTELTSQSDPGPCDGLFADVQGVDASICTGCYPEPPPGIPIPRIYKATALAVDGTYDIGSPWCHLAGGAGITAPTGTYTITEYTGVGGPCQGNVVRTWGGTMDIAVSFADCSLATLTMIYISAGTDTAGTVWAFYWTGTSDVADGDWLSNQLTPCQIFGKSDPNQNIATGGQIRLRYG